VPPIVSTDMHRVVLHALSAWILVHGTLLHDPVPLAEYYSRTLRDYKGLTWDEITPQTASPMLRFRGLTDEEFRRLVRQGYPFIVDDCAPETELKDLPCSEYGRRWPQEHMRAEYTPGQHHIYLKDPTWYSEQKPTQRAPKHLSRGKTLSGPYIWHVKDETEDPRTKPDIMAMFPVPYFLNQSVLNANEARDSFEFWYVLENGGSQAHADAYCETTISLQLRGQKVWRLGAFPNITNAFQPHSFHDSEIYGHEGLWRPEHEEVVGPGQCVVFPMGYIHETYVAEGAGGEDGCSVATTFQIQDPQPVHQWRNFLVRWGLSHYAREEPCLQRMEPYVYMGYRGVQNKGPEAARAQSQQIFRGLDKNGDGLVTQDELVQEYSRVGFRPPWTEVKSRNTLKLAAAEKAKWMAEDAVLFHDTDSDGAISMQEFEESVAKFLAVDERLKTIKRLRKKPAELRERERAWIREHLCTGGGSCSHLEQLDRDYERRRRRKRKQEL